MSDTKETSPGEASASDGTPGETANDGGYVRKPEWLKIKLASGSSYSGVRKELDQEGLNTVCEEARCPNLHECWGTHKTATFMILGDTCTRRCRFCNVKTGLPRGLNGLTGVEGLDWAEPGRVAQAAKTMGLAHVVVTMVNRDDLADGGSEMLARTVRAIRRALPSASIEILSSDLMGKSESIAVLVDSAPDILSHNLETVRRLTPIVRSRSDYDRSLAFLKTCADTAPKAVVKSSLMLGLGETFEEVEAAMVDLRAAGVSVLNMGQYLQPSRNHAPVVKYYSPEEFARLREIGLSHGFAHVESGPLVRSSYHAGAQFEEMKARVRELQGQK